MSLKGTLFCNNDLNHNYVSLMHMLNSYLNSVASKFQIPALNTVGGVAETQTVLQCDMVKISMSFKGT